MEHDPIDKQTKLLRAIPSKENLLEGQFGQPVHNIVINALKKSVPQQQEQMQKPPEIRKVKE